MRYRATGRTPLGPDAFIICSASSRRITRDRDAVDQEHGPGRAAAQRSQGQHPGTTSGCSTAGCDSRTSTSCWPLSGCSRAGARRSSTALRNGGQRTTGGTPVASRIAISSTDYVAADRVGIEAMVSMRRGSATCNSVRKPAGQNDLAKIDVRGATLRTSRRSTRCTQTSSARCAGWAHDRSARKTRLTRSPAPPSPWAQGSRPRMMQINTNRSCGRRSPEQDV